MRRIPMRNLKCVLVLLFTSVAFAQNQNAACILDTAKDGDAITVTGEAVQQPHDLAFGIVGCEDFVVLSYAGDRDNNVSANQLRRDAKLKEFQQYTTATYKGHGKDVCIQCMKYDDVKATLIGRLQVATIPPGTTKDQFGFLHDQSGKVV